MRFRLFVVFHPFTSLVVDRTTHLVARTHVESIISFPTKTTAIRRAYCTIFCAKKRNIDAEHKLGCDFKWFCQLDVLSCHTPVHHKPYTRHLVNIVHIRVYKTFNLGTQGTNKDIHSTFAFAVQRSLMSCKRSP